MNSVLTNTSAMVALQNLRSINNDLSNVQEQISTGKSVSTAKDDAAIFSISNVMQSDVKGFEAVNQSLNLAKSTVGVARNAAEEVGTILNEIKDKIVQAQDGNLDRTKLQDDIDAFVDQIDTIVQSAQFNGVNLLTGTTDLTVTGSLNRSGSTTSVESIAVTNQNLEFSAGTAVNNTLTGTTGVNGNANSAAALTAGSGGTFTLGLDSTASRFTAGDEINVTIGGTELNYTVQTGDDVASIDDAVNNLINDANIAGIASTIATPGVDGSPGTDAALTITNTNTDAVAIEVTVTDGANGGLASLDDLLVTSDSDANAALTSIETFITNTNDASAALGTSERRIEIQSDFVGKLRDSFKTGIGTLTDADLEEASARLQSLQVQQQLGVQALSIANQSPNSVLSLFR